VIRLLYHRQGVPCVPFLAAAASSLLLAQTPCPGLLQAVAAWRSATVLAVLGQLVTQRLDDCRLLRYSLLLLLYLLLQRQHNRYQDFFIQLCKLFAIRLKW
jgi:hypothetical protein